MRAPTEQLTMRRGQFFLDGRRRWRGLFFAHDDANGDHHEGGVHDGEASWGRP